VTSGAEATIVAPPHAVAVEVAPLLVAPLRAARRLRATARPRVARLPAAVAPCRLRRLVEVEVEAEVGAATAGTRATKAGTRTAAARRRAAPRRRDAGEVSPPPALPYRLPVDFGDRIRGVKGRGWVRIQVHCISGPCHPPQVGGGSVVLLIIRGFVIKAKVLTAGLLNPNQVALELKPAAAKTHIPWRGGCPQPGAPAPLAVAAAVPTRRRRVRKQQHQHPHQQQQPRCTCIPQPLTRAPPLQPQPLARVPPPLPATWRCAIPHRLSRCVSLIVSPAVSPSLCLSHCVPHTVSPAVSPSSCLPLCLPHCVPHTVSPAVSPSSCLPLCLPHCVSLTVSPTPSLPLCPPHRVSHSRSPAHHRRSLPARCAPTLQRCKSHESLR
jgi:hypothetical protein